MILKRFWCCNALWLLLRLTKKEVAKEYKGIDVIDHQLKYLTSIEAFTITLKKLTNAFNGSHNPQRKAHSCL
jgi:hypothetical protein